MGQSSTDRHPVLAGRLVLIVGYSTYCLRPCSRSRHAACVCGCLSLISVLGMRVQEAWRRVCACRLGRRAIVRRAACYLPLLEREGEREGCADPRPLFRVGASWVAFWERASLPCYSLVRQPAAGCSRRIDVRIEAVFWCSAISGVSVDALHSPHSCCLVLACAGILLMFGLCGMSCCCSPYSPHAPVRYVLPTSCACGSAWSLWS